MLKHHQMLQAAGIFMLSVACATSTFAATSVQLPIQSATVLQKFASPQLAANPVNLKKITSNTDMQNVTHVRMQETYAGYPVWGADVIFHTPQKNNSALKSLTTSKDTTVNGLLFQDLNKDLQKTPDYVFSANQATKALTHVIDSYIAKTNANSQTINHKKSKLMVYVDQNKKAHWAFLVNFEVHPEQKMFDRPTFIVDAINFTTYEEWNDVKQIELETVEGGGFGGNKKMGRLVFDGLPGNLSKLTMMRNADTNTCFLANEDVAVRTYWTREDGDYKIIKFLCRGLNNEHNSIYWDANLETANGGYSPPNDALYAGKVIQEMYRKWYGVPPLVLDDGQPKKLDMIVHLFQDNAYWDGNAMFFGDGIFTFYPLTSLGVGAHEVSHGFTEQHSGLFYSKQSGGLNEAFSDMAAQAAEFYSTGTNSWEIGPEIFKKNGRALRYMDDPTKDGKSIGNIKDYYDGLDVHYSSGVFNKAYYLIGTSEGWDAKKAFDVMVKANMAYWRTLTDFQAAANCVLKATQDLNYDVEAVKKAFEGVGITSVDASQCV